MLSPFLFGAALFFGQAEDATGTPTAPASSMEAAEAPESAPDTPADEPAASNDEDAGFLTSALEGTWLGRSLDSHQIQVSGWTEGSFTGSSASDSQLPMGFNYRANDFLLQQNWLRVERQVVTQDATGPSWGFRSDTILPGADYRFTLPRGLWDGQLRANDGGPNTYGIDPVQFYGEAYFPDIAQGLDVKVGRLFCQYGAETIDAPPNQLASHAYTFIYNPFTHTGGMATVQLDDAWSVMGGVMTGPDVFIDPAASPYGMLTLKWAPAEGSDSLSLSSVFGSGRFDAAEQLNNPNIFDLVWIHTFHPKLSYMLDALYGYQEAVPGIGTATWFGIVNYLTYKFSDQLAGTTRLEFFDDIDGNRTGFAGLYTAVTVGVNCQPCQQLIIRPELRYDTNDESRPFEGEHGLVTVAFDAIVRW